jgi:DNA processing protein
LVERWADVKSEKSEGRFFSSIEFLFIALSPVGMSGFGMFENRLEECPDVLLRPGDSGYPPLLACIEAPPDPLRVCGRVDDLAAFLGAPTIGIVGSRDCGMEAEAFARRLGRDLAQAGWVVVSGLARGIDAAAHHGALEAGGRTLAVVGCGLDVVYPRVNRELRAAIRDRGLLVGEYSPGTPPRKQNFPARNRILSGLSCGVVVVEASERSGSLITARLALEQGREVLAVPGSPLDGRSRGSNALLREGAGLVESAADVVAALPWLASWEPLLRRAGENPASSHVERSPLEALIDQGVQVVDTLASATQRPVGELQAELFVLERDGRIRRLRDGSYRLV